MLIRIYMNNNQNSSNMLDEKNGNYNIISTNLNAQLCLKKDFVFFWFLLDLC